MASDESQKRCVDYVTPIPLQKGFHYSLSPIHLFIHLYTTLNIQDESEHFNIQP